MVTPEYCREMARYNAWQNNGLRAIVNAMPMEALQEDRGAFFGSIWGTLNHVLWADQFWMSRWSDVVAPKGRIKDSVTFTATRGDWEAARFRTDGAIRLWADSLKALDLTGDLTWFSGIHGREITRRKGLCIAHFFNHQTHHRGQLHAMLTAAGAEPGPTDLIFMPDAG